MVEFWEETFKTKQEMWGSNAADCAMTTADMFYNNGLRKILIPGAGYGRNMKPFIDLGLEVTGIEISKTAIDLAKKHFGSDIKIHLGSVEGMPFDNERFDGIFCYGLIHLLNAEQRKKLLQDCYNQLNPQGRMVFVAISTNTSAYGSGEQLEHNTFLTPHGVRIFYYDAAAVKQEFDQFGLQEAEEINEPKNINVGVPTQKFWQITCTK